MRRLNSLTYKKIELFHGTLTYAVDITNGIPDEGNSVTGSVTGTGGYKTTENTEELMGTGGYESEEEVYIIEYSGHDILVEIPEKIDGMTVVGIEKKAFLSNKSVRQIVLPKTILELGDFAFARCSNLKKIEIPYKSLKLGQSVFLDCDSLEQIVNVGNIENKKKNSDIGYLLAATTGMLEAPYLFDLERAGSDEWFQQWDKRMLSKMEVDDSEGFSKMLLCGEEDYGSNETDPDFYRHQKRMAKCRVAMLRLMHDSMLDEVIKKNLTDYLLQFIKGGRFEETWDIVLNEHGDDKAYYEFLADIGGVTEDNLLSMLSDMGDRHPEMKAYLMKYNEELHKDKDAFDLFEL